MGVNSHSLSWDAFFIHNCSGVLRNAPEFSIFAPTNRFLCAIIGFRPVYRPARGGFFVVSRIWPFLGDFSGFCDPGGTTYHSLRKSV